MKKTILLALMAVMVATPCFAQEVEPEGIFSVEGTLWSHCRIRISIPRLPYFYIGCGGDYELGFYHGEAYTCYVGHDCRENFIPVINLGFVSIAWHFSYDIGHSYYYLAIMQPTIGLGVYSEISFPGGPTVFSYEIGVMFKIDDNWTPEGVE